MRISSRTAQAETPKYWLQQICNKKFEISYFFDSIFFEDTK
jgi:hypothetical protein